MIGRGRRPDYTRHSADCIKRNRTYRCVPCHGAGICHHRRVKTFCRDCGGGAICKEHGRQRHTCADCVEQAKEKNNRNKRLSMGDISGDEVDVRAQLTCTKNENKDTTAVQVGSPAATLTTSAVFEVTSRGKKGGGKGWWRHSRCLEHNKMKYSCKLCKGKGICEHGKMRYTCKVCGGKGICQHGRVRQGCARCQRQSLQGLEQSQQSDAEVVLPPPAEIYLEGAKEEKEEATETEPKEETSCSVSQGSDELLQDKSNLSQPIRTSRSSTMKQETHKETVPYQQQQRQYHQSSTTWAIIQSIRQRHRQSITRRRGNRGQSQSIVKTGNGQWPSENPLSSTFDTQRQTRRSSSGVRAAFFSTRGDHNSDQDEDDNTDDNDQIPPTTMPKSDQKYKYRHWLIGRGRVHSKQRRRGGSLDNRLGGHGGHFFSSAQQGLRSSNVFQRMQTGASSSSSHLSVFRGDVIPALQSRSGIQPVVSLQIEGQYFLVAFLMLMVLPAVSLVASLASSSKLNHRVNKMDRGNHTY